MDPAFNGFSSKSGSAGKKKMENFGLIHKSNLVENTLKISKMKQIFLF